MYYSDEARMSAIESIRDCIEKIGRIKGSELSYQDARKTSAFLSMLIDEIMKESRRQNKNKNKKPSGWLIAAEKENKNES